MSRIDEFDIVIRRKAGTFVAGIPAVRLYAKARSMEDALAELALKKKTFESDLVDAGRLEDLEAGDVAASVSGSRFASELLFFAMKAGIVIGLIAAVSLICGAIAVARIEGVIDSTIYTARMQLLNAKIDGADFWKKVEAICVLSSTDGVRSRPN